MSSHIDVKKLNEKYISKCDFLENDYYGALTGEDSASDFIKCGQIKLEKNDIVVVYSDGFSEFLHEQEFISLILNFQQEKFEEYINMKSKEDYNKYGKEKTLVLFKNIN